MASHVTARRPLQHRDRRHPSPTRLPGSVADVLVDPHLAALADGRPINVYVIEHRDGVVVFDTGQDRASVTDPSYFPDGAERRDLPPPRDVPRRRGRDVDGRARTPRLPHRRRHHRGDQPSPPGPHRRHRRDCPTPTCSSPPTSGGRCIGRWPDPRPAPRPHRAPRPANWTPVDFEPLDDPALRPVHRGHDLFGDGSLDDPPDARTHAGFDVDVRAPGRRTSAAARRRPHLRHHAFERGTSSGVGSRRRLRQTRERVPRCKRANPGMPILAAHDPAAADLLAAAAPPQRGLRRVNAPAELDRERSTS